jgi:hypothetical protein
MLRRESGWKQVFMEYLWGFLLRKIEGIAVMQPDIFPVSRDIGQV